MLRHIGLAITIGCALFVPLSSAAAQHMNEIGNPCEGAGSMLDGSSCWGKELEKADEQLNSVYSRIMGVLRSKSNEEQTQKRLRAAQLAWIDYRDKACEAEASLYSGGSAKGMARLACLTSLTDDRIKALRLGFWWQVEKFG